MPVKTSRRTASLIASIRSRTKQPAKPKTRKGNVVEVYQSAQDQQWYWRAKGRNGDIIAIGGESFKRKGGASKAKVVKALVTGGFHIVIVPNPLTVHETIAATVDPIVEQSRQVVASQPNTQYGSTPVVTSDRIGSTPLDGSGNPVQGSAGDEHNPDVSKP